MSISTSLKTESSLSLRTVSDVAVFENMSTSAGMDPALYFFHGNEIETNKFTG
jgi:hypothetical protein